MKNIQVKSLPFRDVIRELATSFNTNYSEKCDETFLKIPESIGEGTIRGINFNNGLGIIIYDCKFLEEVEIRFTKNEIHPVKYLYTAKGELKHYFLNDETTHLLHKLECAIVASKGKNGHILEFKANENIYVVSLEIDRTRFFSELKCELSQLDDDLKSLFYDAQATHAFYHKGFYSIAFEQLISSLHEHGDEMMLRKLFLEAKALEIFIKQIALFQDDLKSDQDKAILRQSELHQISEIAEFISQDLSQDLKVENLARKSGLNPNKLQIGFKFKFGITVNQYVMNQRMLKASILLKTTDYSLGQVSEAVGISSKSYFSKTFKNHFGILPSAYQKKF